MGFNEVYKYTKKFEGGYVNNVYDMGGETFRGISRKNWPNWEGWQKIDEIKKNTTKTPLEIDMYFAKNITMENSVKDFYYLNFWLPLENFNIFEKLKEKIFDTAVHMGLKQAIKLLQLSINKIISKQVLKIDGLFGALTAQAFNVILNANENKEDLLIKQYSLKQAQYYKKIVICKPKQNIFLNSWLKRAKWRP